MWLLVLFATYPLSVGPSAWLLYQVDPNGEGWVTDAFHITYKPLSAAIVGLGAEPVHDWYNLWSFYTFNWIARTVGLHDDIGRPVWRKVPSA